MNEKIYLKDYILNYDKLNNYLIFLEKKYYSKFKKEKSIGKTTLGYDINIYKIGHGKKHVLIMGATHGTEIVTVYFVLELIITLLEDTKIYLKYNKDFTFHFIPLVNPEGFIISTSSLHNNLNTKNLYEIEKISKKYLQCYNIDDKIAMNQADVKVSKLYRNVLQSKICDLPINFKSNVKKILMNCNLDEGVLPTWSANSCGIDINSNSIHKFKEIVALRKKQKFAKLRYNDIPVNKPSPMSFPGKFTFELRCPENLALYNYIDSLFSKNLDYSCKDNLVALFSYHSTGGEIYGYPDINYASLRQIRMHIDAMEIYSKYTGYKKINENLKYGIMDFYRIILDDVVSLTIELSKLNGNPIGPFSDINLLNNEIINNKKAIFATLDSFIK